MTRLDPGRCAVCGLEGNWTVLDVDHIRPLGSGGTSSPSNLSFMCSNCHSALNGLPLERRFTQYLAALLEASPRFREVVMDGKIPGTSYRPDIVAVLTETDERILIECKRWRVARPSQLTQAFGQLEDYSSASGIRRLVLAFPGSSQSPIAQHPSGMSMDVWDLERIGQEFAKEIAKVDEPYFSAILRGRTEKRTIEDEFLRRLEDCPAGTAGWLEYQKLVGRILEHLFCPPLSAPISEHSDHFRTNRRDYIFPNYATEGFWYFLRNRYSADYVVVDAKNGKGRIQKSHVLQICNYLKEHGVGRFGMIICREGIDRGASVTLREQWVLYGKLIVVLSHREIKDMLLIKAMGGDPSATIGDYIQKFRLSM